MNSLQRLFEDAEYFCMKLCIRLSATFLTSKNSFVSKWTLDQLKEDFMKTNSPNSFKKETQTMPIRLPRCFSYLFAYLLTYLLTYLQVRSLPYSFL